MIYPKISVIVPVFKTEAFISKCLESILSQTFSDFEIICVDDCSPDGSMKIVEKFADSDERIRIIRHQNNKGLGGARNTGIVAARGEYIASVDSDDYISPSMLQALWEGAHNGHFDVVVCGYDRVDESGAVLTSHMRSTKQLDPIPAGTDPFRISNPAFWNKLWRRSLYVDNDIYFPEHIYYQDAATTPRVYLKTRSVNFIGGDYYKYLVRRESVTNSKGDKHLLDKYRELDTVKSFLITEGLYGAHQRHFEQRVQNTFAYHAGEIVANDPEESDSVTSYLRHLLLLKHGYLSDDAARRLSRQALIATLVGVSEAKARSSQPANSARVLILTMYSGENELPRMIASLRAQTYRNWSHEIIHNFGNQEAHSRLYQTIMRNSDEFDIFVKVDADTIFARPEVLAETVNYFAERPTADNLIVACDDFMTGRQIMGVHAFSNRVHWSLNSDGLFLDPRPHHHGGRKEDRAPKKSFYLHSPDPTPLQAFHFGAHRALKVAQRDRPVTGKRPYGIWQQWAILHSVWDRYEITRDRRLGLALYAANLVFTGALKDGAHDYADKGLGNAFDAANRLRSADLFQKLAPLWRGEAARTRYFVQAAEIEKIRQNGGLELSELAADNVALAKSLASKRDMAGVNAGTFSRLGALQKSKPFKLYARSVSPFLSAKRRRDLEIDPVRFLARGKHPATRIGRHLFKRYL